MAEFKKEIILDPAWDRRHKDPNKNYGIHGVNLTFYLTGEKGVVQLVVYTNWYLPHVQQFPFLEPVPADVGYHSYTPMYEGQTILRDKCELLGGKPCYYDGSSLQAEEVFKILLNGGSEAVWKELEQQYNELFMETNDD